MLILANEDAETLLTMADCIAALEAAYREQAKEEAVNAARSDAVTQAGRPDAIYSLKLMGAVVRSLGVGVVRLNSDIISFANQRQKKLPLAPGGRYTGLVPVCARTMVPQSSPVDGCWFPVWSQIPCRR
jgi:hypothetical protein